MLNNRVGNTIVNADATVDIVTVCDGGITFGNDPSVNILMSMSERHIRNVTSISSLIFGVF